MLWKEIRQLRLIASQTVNPEEKSKVRMLQKLQQGATHVTDARVLPENVTTAPRAGGNVSEPKQGPIEGNKAKFSSCYRGHNMMDGQAKASQVRLIVGAPYLDPWTVAQCMLSLLASSAPFVIYHPYSQTMRIMVNKVRFAGCHAMIPSSVVCVFIIGSLEDDSVH